MLFARLNALQRLSTVTSVADSTISRLAAVNRKIQQSPQESTAQETGKASQDAAFAQRTVNSLLYEMNLRLSARSSTSMRRASVLSPLTRVEGFASGSELA